MTTPLFSGKAELGTTVTLYAGTDVIGTGKTNAAGAWAIKATALTDGTHLIGARAFDLAGNQSVVSDKLAVIIDTTPPGTPTVTTLTAKAIAGKADPGTRVTITEGPTKLGVATTGSTGIWTVATTLVSGVHAVDVIATDTVGNTEVYEVAVFVGTTGPDTITGTLAADILDGREGDDTYDANHSGDMVIEFAGGGNDTVRASVNYTLPAFARIEFLRAATGASGLTLRGNEQRNQIIGSSGADVFGVSALTHSLVAAGSQDVVTDFSIAEGDLIDLAGLDAILATAAEDPFTFIGSSAFSGVAGQLRAVAAGGSTTISGDITGDTLADFAISLSGNHTLTVGQFVL